MELCPAPAACPMRCRLANPSFLSLRRLTLRVFCGLVLFSGVIDARAHRPAESSAQLRWEHGRLEGQLVFSLQIATTILGDPDITLINAENFPVLRERLATRLGEAFTVQSAGRALQPDQLTISLALEGEILGNVVFASSEPAAVEIRAAFLERCPPDAFCWIRVWSGADRLLAQKLLVRATPQALFPAPGQPSPPEKPAP
jgi:hypothetical protein